jgi:tRNA pseudouridine38-40 synthase
VTRYKLVVEYDGSDFVGWQRQTNGPSVQAALEDAVKGFCGEITNVYGAGRTDSGVHALAQVAHVDIDRDTTAKTVRDALNAHLRQVPVSVLSATIVPAAFHARFSAIERVYRYRIINRRSPPAIRHGQVWHVPVPLDTEAMDDAAQVLVGKHDFTTFRATLCQAKSPVKTLTSLHIVRHDDDISVHARARSFLHHQVRNIVGTLKLVGAGKWTKADVESALAACDRTRGGPTAPAQGLYLTEVVYPEVIR